MAGMVFWMNHILILYPALGSVNDYPHPHTSV